MERVENIDKLYTEVIDPYWSLNVFPYDTKPNQTCMQLANFKIKFY